MAKKRASDNIVRALARKTNVDAEAVARVLKALGAEPVLDRASRELGPIDASQVRLYVQRGKPVRNLVITAGGPGGASTTIMV